MQTDDAIMERIREFVADAADIPFDSVGPDDDLYQTLGVDSLGATAIFIDISYEFRVPEPSPDADLAIYNTPRRLVDYVRQFRAVD